ncbi:NAD(P)H-quinone oxidoreductase chain 4, putative [Medicago truncatula]|uniref:NAD(P)H-quinone oxidoreductase chain 4, putative n=1 Tax=Medicago truncatula TaxID=3880 RepID=A0A072W0I7_MEDTR|nr:NAD(P)H-quinone oxidoreductase chain 4, putative [Medicago truncatula]
MNISAVDVLYGPWKAVIPHAFFSHVVHGCGHNNYSATGPEKLPFFFLLLARNNLVSLGRFIFQIFVLLFFDEGTSYDKLRLLYLDEMSGMAIPMPKIFTIFTILSMTSLALSGMSGLVA